MTDAEDLACADLGLLKEVQEANNLIRACVPRLLAARAKCVEHSKAEAGIAEAANGVGADSVNADEADNAAAKYRFLVGFIEELTTRYA